ncbi:GntR family transcriptional regulator [Streptomyces rhizosphaericus]|uniref:GntR family transcriptional regulator n=1 Tax=Streptomyces rhizosphaericus TaxID=114699 RepID=UPI000A35F3B6
MIPVGTRLKGAERANFATKVVAAYDANVELTVRRICDHTNGSYGLIYGMLSKAGVLRTRAEARPASKRLSKPPRPPRVSEVDRVAQIIRRDIQSGRFKPGDRIPTAQELARQHKIHRSTSALAMRQLANEGLLDARPGKGTWVPLPGDQRGISTTARLIIQMRQEVLSGKLTPGDPLPSIRLLAARFNTSTGTVQMALPQLLSEMVIEPRTASEEGCRALLARRALGDRFRIASPRSWRQPPSAQQREHTT